VVLDVCFRSGGAMRGGDSKCDSCDDGESNFEVPEVTVETLTCERSVKI